jgi:hypothetical protein
MNALKKVNADFAVPNICSKYGNSPNFSASGVPNTVAGRLHDFLSQRA